MDKGKERISNRIIRQSHYCQNYFAKNEETMQKHLSICAAKESITYSFDNSQIIYCQDNFKYTLCISILKLLQEMLFS